MSVPGLGIEDLKNAQYNEAMRTDIARINPGNKRFRKNTEPDDAMSVDLLHCQRMTGMTNSNSLQIEMYFNGTIRMTWLRIDYSDVPQGGAQSHGITGLSRGTNRPQDFVASDLSASGSCLTEGSLVVPSVVMEGESAIQGTILLSAALTTNLLVTHPDWLPSRHHRW